MAALAKQLSAQKDTRVELRTSLDIKEKLRTAASLAGVDLSSFIIMAATREAQHMIDAEHTRYLNEQAWNKMNAILESSPEPTEALIDLMTRAPRYVRR
ncbi:type II toxin-antitoxin system TacA family antitoxin [Pantoea agglomerans]|jgi:uncharacterized protein (DUF1778 family)|uniref:type II toxin-antitoxin system TacA family antitoxin n=1 Tax=Enterobacter agglomerans TaxID=549 RepID=UPI001F0DCCF6|nr:DUF1778 domain-containing protein [Pantoea agglomerans]WNK42261.1 DUF1778 domain-containing protein [Pantoea agglomerans]